MQARINQIQIYYEDRGTGLPVVFLHGYPLSHAIWNPMLEKLEGPYRLIAPDLRGHGRTQTTPGVYSMELFARDAAELLDALRIDNVVLVGHSMGGYAAMAFARLYPGRLAGLGLVATRAGADTPAVRANRLATAAEVLQNGVAAIAAGMPPRLTANPALIAAVAEMIAAMDPQGIAGSLRGMAARSDATDTLRTLPVPALVIAGDQDEIAPVEEAHRMAKIIPNCRLVIVPGARHLPMLENPAQTAAGLGEFLKGIQLD